MIFELFGGLGLFIFGMKQMSEGLQKAAGKKLKQLLNLLTTNKYMGLLVGTVVTAIIQSSSATTVMVVGFVNAGLMTLTQSIGVIMGANIGTTVTAQLIAFKLSHYSLHAVAIGAFLYLFSRRDSNRQIGQVILGFGILFLGLIVMKDTMKPLKDWPVFAEYMKQFGNIPILGLLIGTGMTVLLQSSSASIGIILSLVSIGVVGYETALPILLGGNIGTTITALLSSIGANKTAKRAAFAHLTFNVVGALTVILLMHIIPGFSHSIENAITRLSTMIIPNPSPERLLANTHTIFNLLNTILWLPLVGFMVTLVQRLVPGEDISIKRGLNFLDERMLETPGVAINQLKNEVLHMFEIAHDMVINATAAFMESDQSKVKAVIEKEDIVNELEEELVNFLTKFPRNTMSENDVKSVDMYYAMIDDIESIGDDAHDIAELAKFKYENKITFSDEARKTLDSNFDMLYKLMPITFKIIESRDRTLADEIFRGEEAMDEFQLKHRNGHMERLGAGICNPNAGIIYLEVLDDMEHISDQMADITHSILEAE